MLRALLPVAALCAGLAMAPAAQADRETLADIRQELAVLSVEMQRLLSELSTTQGAGTGLGGGSVLDRVNAMEGELSRLIARTEELELRIQRIVADGTNRIADLEFRLVELEGGDPGSLPMPAPLGGEQALAPAAGPPDTGRAEPLLAVSERDDFARARAAYDEGDYATAISRFASFVETYPGGPLTSDAIFLRGQAHAEIGETAQAARAFLDAFNTDPGGQRAPQALLRLGQSLIDLGQREEGCLMLAEVGNRYPASEFVVAAEDSARVHDCR